MYSTKTVSSQTTSPWIPLDDNQAAFSATIAVAVSGTLTYSVEFTLDNVQDPAVTPVAFPAGLVGETTSKSTYIKYPVKAVRLNVTAFTSGSATIGVRQGTDNVWGYPDSTDFAEAFSTTPKTVLSIGTPFAILPGDGAAAGMFFTGTAGAFTLSAAILANAWNLLKGCWCYLPANFGGFTYPAGWYWAVFSSDTAGILYNTTYTSGSPIRPTSPIPFVDNLAGWLTQTTSEVTGPTGFTLKGGSMGPNGKLKFHTKVTGNITSTKAYSVFLGSNKLFWISPMTTSPVGEFLVSSSNQGSDSLQASSRISGIPGVGNNAANYTGTPEHTSINTSLDHNVSISLQTPALNTACAILLYADLSVTYGA